MTRQSARHGRRTRRSAWRPLAAAAIGAAVLLIGGQGVWAALSASATNVTPQSAGTGTLALTMAPNGVGFGQAVSAMAPGDVVNRYVDLTNSGTLAGQQLTFAVASTGATALRTDATRGLRVAVNSCSGTWNAATGACSGTVTSFLAPTLVGNLSNAATIVAGAVPAGQVHRLQVSLQLPAVEETTVNGVAPAGSVQGQSAQLTYTFAQVQRTATTTTS